MKQKTDKNDLLDALEWVALFRSLLVTTSVSPRAENA